MVELKPASIKFNDQRTVATVVVEASGADFASQIETLNGMTGQSAALKFAAEHGLSGQPSIRKIASAAYPVDVDGGEIDHSNIAEKSIHSYRVSYVVAGGIF